MNIDVSLNLLRGSRDRNRFSDPAFVINLNAEINYIETLRARLTAAESELASVKKGGAEFIHPVEELIGGPNACGICGRNDGLHYAHE